MKHPNICINLLITALVFSQGCDKNSADETSSDTTSSTTASGAISSPDLSAADINSEINALIPGSLVLSLAGSYGSPCKNAENGDPAGPDQNTIQCKMANLFADPDVYGNVGQEGFLESIAIFTKVFKLSLKDCTNPLADGAQNVSVPVIGATQKFACGRTVPIDELVTNLKAGMSDFANVPANDLKTAFADSVISLLWGVEGANTTSENQNIMAMMDLAPKKAGDSREKTMWWYGKDAANSKIHLRSVMFKGDATNRRYLSGNPDTHEFNLNYRWVNQNGSYVSLRGTGYSQGQGKFYLIEGKGSGITNAKDNSSLDGTQTLSFCIDAGTGAVAADASCAGLSANFEADLENLTFYEDADLPASENDISAPTFE